MKTYQERIIVQIILIAACLFSGKVSAQVKYDEGRLTLLGVQLLQDYKNPNQYYYLPQSPHLAQKEDGTLELLCMKYVGEKSDESGGLFHALVEFTLPENYVDSLKKELQKVKPGAELAGQVPLMQPESKNGENKSLEIISAVLSNKDSDQPFTKSVIHSGHAPLTPGSKAAVAAILNQQGATLLWNSMSGPTSDVSVTVNACYEAVVKAYNAVVEAEMSVIYEHFSKVFNKQKNYTRRQLREISDELKKDGKIKIEVFDRSKGLGIDAKDMAGILDIVTERLISLMFDAETGWSKDPEREVGVESGQLLGRQKRSWFSKTFGKTKDTKYYTDNQYVIKDKKDVRTNKFYLNLSKSTTVKVPVHSSGNLGGIYSKLGNDERYFRIVDLNDVDFQKREINFQIDGDFVSSFDEVVNFVAVNFRKRYNDKHDDVTRQLFFNKNEIKEGKIVQAINFPRLGIKEAEWQNYEYRVNWSIKGEDKPLTQPEEESVWIHTDRPAVSLRPPFDKRNITIDADRAMFKDFNIKSAVVDFAVILAGKPKKLKSVILRADDAESTSSLSIYKDRKEDAVYRITWYTDKGPVKESLRIMDSDYMVLFPPAEISDRASE